MEKWKVIQGTNGFYEASTKGRIRSTKRTITTRNRWGVIKKRMKAT